MNAATEPRGINKFFDEVVRAFQEYLKLPSIVILIFIALGIGIPALEQAGIPLIDTLDARLGTVMLGDESSTRDILAGTAGALFTVASITFTVLLLAVQQAASTMTPQILDQFLRRPINGFVFGYFVGVPVYSLIVLASVHRNFNPVLATLVLLIFSAFALYLLAALVYVTVTQMRPAVVIHAIHDDVLRARKRQAALLKRTRREPASREETSVPIYGTTTGYVSYIDLERIERAIGNRPRDGFEIAFCIRIGTYLANGDLVAEIRGAPPQGPVEDLKSEILHAVRLGVARDLQYDPEHGIAQIVDIGWSTLSTAKHMPVSGAQTIHALRDLLGQLARPEEPAPDSERLPVVYEDPLPRLPVLALESLAVAATESQQAQTFALVLQTLGDMYGRLPGERQAEVESVIERVLPNVEKFVLTMGLDQSLAQLAENLERAGRRKTAELICTTLDQAQKRIPRPAGRDGAGQDVEAERRVPHGDKREREPATQGAE